MDEEMQFLIIAGGAGIVAASLIIYDTFSLQRFWARLTRSRNPPTRETLAEAQTRHHRFFLKTSQRVFSTTYVSFYLFSLSFLEIVVVGFFFQIQKNGELSLRCSYLLIFLLISRWYYREHHSPLAHYLFSLLSCVMIVDTVHLLTQADYLGVTLFFIMMWMWTGGILRAVLQFEAAYQRNMAFSIGLPFALIAFLVLKIPSAIFIVLAPLPIFLLVEMVTRSQISPALFPHPLPFKPTQPELFLRDILRGLLPTVTFRGCSLVEVLFWGSLTPFVLIPVTQYLQGREELLLKQHKSLVTWTQNEYFLSPETVADRFGLTLENTYPLLNEMVEEGTLNLYESPAGLVYGLPPTEEMMAFIEKFNLRRSNLPQREGEFIEYLWEKARMAPSTVLSLSVIKNGHIEVSAGRVGGTLSPLKSSYVLERVVEVESLSHDIIYTVDAFIKMLTKFGGKKGADPRHVLTSLQNLGSDLFCSLIPSEVTREFTSSLLLETNTDIPFELMWDGTFFSLKYAIGRQLRVRGPVTVEREQREKLRALIVVDPRMQGAVREGDYLREKLSRLIETRLVTNATPEEIIHHFNEGYSIIHYAGHITEEGIPFSGGSLDSAAIQASLRGRPLVFVNGCSSAGKLAKIAEGFLRGGALACIGSLWEIHDVAAAELSVDFYANCLQRHMLGEALRLAKERAFSSGNVAWLCFILVGDPTLQLI